MRVDLSSEDSYRTRALTETTIPCLTMALVILGMDTLISSSLRCAVITTIESILSDQSFSKQTELSTLKAIHEVIVKLVFTIDDQARLLGLLSGCSSVSGRVRRWIAWSMLGGDLDVVTIEQYDNFPPFSDISNLFLKDAPGKLKMVIHSEVDYKVLGIQTDILSVVMSDIEGYTREAGGKEFVEETYRDLDKILGKISKSICWKYTILLSCLTSCFRRHTSRASRSFQDQRCNEPIAQ